MIIRLFKRIVITNKVMLLIQIGINNVVTQNDQCVHKEFTQLNSMTQLCYTNWSYIKTEIELLNKTYENVSQKDLN